MPAILLVPVLVPVLMSAWICAGYIGPAAGKALFLLGWERRAGKSLVHENWDGLQELRRNYLLSRWLKVKEPRGAAGALAESHLRAWRVAGPAGVSPQSKAHAAGPPWPGLGRRTKHKGLSTWQRVPETRSLMSSAAPRARPWSQAQRVADEIRQHRSLAATLGRCRPGFCMSEAWDQCQAPMDGSFDLDGPVLQALLRPAGPPPPPTVRDPGAVLHDYLYPPDSGAAPLSPRRLADETAGAVYGAGNIVGNTATALAGGLQWHGERDAARALAEGIRAILAGRASTVPLAPGMELYNAASGRQRPRVRLRVREAMVPMVRQSVAVSSAAAMQWRINGPGNAASLGAARMSPQQMRQMALHAGEARLPGALRRASSLEGGGVLTFAPAALLDGYAAIETDLGGARSFNGRKFLVSQARSQSGNAVGMVGGMLAGVAVGMIGVAGAPLVLVGLAGGIICQIVWNCSGANDIAAETIERALR